MRYASILSEAIETEKSNSHRANPSQLDRICDFASVLRLCAKRQLRKLAKPQRRAAHAVGHFLGKAAR